MFIQTLTAVESEWRRFQHIADCTAFQTFEWLSTWHRHIGASADAFVPVIVVGRFADGDDRLHRCRSPSNRGAGSNGCDGSAKTCAITMRRCWRAIFPSALRPSASLRYGESCADSCNPIRDCGTIGSNLRRCRKRSARRSIRSLALRVTPNANSAHITLLGDDWETFYRAKRSSATRRRDRSKRKHMAEFGDIRFSTVDRAATTSRRTLETLWEQKTQIFARKGIADIFAQPGYREFFADFASNPNTRSSGPCQPCRYRPHLRGGEFRADIRRLLLSRAVELLRRTIGTHYGPGALHLRELLAHAIGHGPAAVSISPSATSITRLEWSDLRLKLFDYSAAATWRGWPASLAATVWRRAQALHQANAAGLAFGLPRPLGGRTVLTRPSVPPASPTGYQDQGFTAADGARLRHGRHGFAAADRDGRHSVARS